MESSDSSSTGPAAAAAVGHSVMSRAEAAAIGAGVRARYLSGNMADDGYREQALKRGDEGVQLAEAARDTLRSL